MNNVIYQLKSITRHITKAEAAAALETSTDALEKYISGSREPRAEVKRRIINLYVKTRSIITARREALGLTQKELADLCGVHETTVHKWELHGMKSARTYNIVMLATVLNISTDELLRS